jgi:hypothetical protein
MGSLDRRSFLIGAGLAAGAFAGGSTVAFLIGRDDERDEPDGLTDLPTSGRLGALAAILGDPAAARRVGAVYRHDHPSAPETDPLEGVATRAPFRQRQVDLVQPVRDRAHVDFLRGDVVEVAGWVLPRSVADLCAVAHRDLS